jgi:hypothetical protein
VTAALPSPENLVDPLHPNTEYGIAASQIAPKALTINGISAPSLTFEPLFGPSRNVTDLQAGRAAQELSGCTIEQI